MAERITYLNGAWNPVDDEAKAAFRLIESLDDDGHVVTRRRESLGKRKGLQTYSTDPRAGAIMREGNGSRPMSNPTGR